MKCGEARPGPAWRGRAWRGKARILFVTFRWGMAGPGMVWRGSAGQGEARISFVTFRRGTAWLVRARPGQAGRGRARRGFCLLDYGVACVARLGEAKCGVARHGEAKTKENTMEREDRPRRLWRGTFEFELPPDDPVVDKKAHEILAISSVAFKSSLLRACSLWRIGKVSDGL